MKLHADLAHESLGPVVSGFLEVTKSWQWSFYVLIWLSAVSLGLEVRGLC